MTPAARRLRACIAAQLEAEPIDVPSTGPHSLRGFREHHNALPERLDSRGYLAQWEAAVAALLRRGLRAGRAPASGRGR